MPFVCIILDEHQRPKASRGRDSLRFWGLFWLRLTMIVLVNLKEEHHRTMPQIVTHESMRRIWAQQNAIEIFRFLVPLMTKRQDVISYITKKRWWNFNCFCYVHLNLYLIWGHGIQFDHIFSGCVAKKAPPTSYNRLRPGPKNFHMLRRRFSISWFLGALWWRPAASRNESKILVDMS